jgi:hypothetical protein
MMSNNAPGFSHVSFSTNKPVKSIFGSFEWQIIGGFALSDDKIPEQVYSLKSFEEFAIPLGWPRDKILSNYNKYFNGVTFSFSPKFLKTLKLGFSRAYIASFADIQSNIVERVGFVKAYIPLFASVFKESRIGFEDSLEWNQLASISARLLLPKANAEIYVEYGWNDYKYNLRDFIISPTHSAAYIVGAKKVLQVSKYKAIDFSVEVSNLGQSPDFLVRDAGNWYIHTARSNYTNWGQSLGSGFGLGSNTFHFSAVMRNRFDQFGFVYSNSKKDPLRFATQWHEHLFSFNFRKKIHHFLINSDLGFLYSRNYGWDAGKNRFNFMGMMGLSYFF